MKESKVKQSETREVKRSEINFANYNPRRITPEARKKLKANLRSVGVLGGIVWNESSGNLVSGHQKVSIIDEMNHYNPESQENDYMIKVEVVNMDDKTEKEQNIFMNNRSVQGEFDPDMLKEMLEDIDYKLAGLEEFDLNLMGLGDIGFEVKEEKWVKEDVLDERTAIVDQMTKEGGENKNIDRRTDFYNDSRENQIARHNEVQKIKDRINAQNSSENDNGMLSYVVLSFDTPSERARFMETFGYTMEDRYINGKEFMDRVEFGVDE